MPNDLSRETASAIEWECARLLTRFFNAFDQWRYADMVAMFAPNGVWHRAGKQLTGDAILEALNERSRTQTVRHVVTNIQIDVRDASSAEFILYITVYMHDTGIEATAPPKISAPYLLLVVPGTLMCASEGWKIASMRMNREFEF